VPKAIPLDVRKEIIARCLQGENQADISADLGLHFRTVGILWGRYREHGDAGLIPDYARCGRRRSDSQTAFLEAACAYRREHPEWSAEVIHQQLVTAFPDMPLPSSRSLQRWLETEGCNRRRGRPSASHSQAGKPAEGKLGLPE
jgi:transposase